MYRLFSRINGGLTPVAESFKKHVESEGSRLVKEVTEAAARAEREKKEAGRHRMAGILFPLHLPAWCNGRGSQRFKPGLNALFATFLS